MTQTDAAPGQSRELRLRVDVVGLGDAVAVAGVLFVFGFAFCPLLLFFDFAPCVYALANSEFWGEVLNSVCSWVDERNLRCAMRFCIRLLSSGSVTSDHSTSFAPALPLLGGEEQLLLLLEEGSGLCEALLSRCDAGMLTEKRAFGTRLKQNRIAIGCRGLIVRRQYGRKKCVDCSASREDFWVELLYKSTYSTASGIVN